MAVEDNDRTKGRKTKRTRNMKLMCISNGGKKSKTTRLNIEIGEIYEGFLFSEGKYERRYFIYRKDGTTNTYSDICVIPLDEWREKQLKEIGI